MAPPVPPQIDAVRDGLKELSTKQPVMKIRQLFYKLAHGDDEDYEQFENRSMESGEMSTFRENDPSFRLFGSGVHVKTGTYIAGVIGLFLTVCYCVSYSLYHTRGQGRNEFIDHLELVDLIFAFIVGIPCHIMLFIAICQERKTFFGPFLIFYATNFILNVVFTFLTIVAAAFDFHRQLFGNVKYDFSWTAFQLLWTGAQALAIYVVLKCRRYIAARNHFKMNSFQANSSNAHSITADSVTLGA